MLFAAVHESAVGTELPIRNVRSHGQCWGQSGLGPDIVKMARLIQGGPQDDRHKPRWDEGAVVLLGDACHPMTPYMTQGAASALEDAAMLSRCVAASDAAEGFRHYEATRLGRASRLQLTSRRNTWGRHRVDPDWVYGYDVWEAPIGDAASSAQAAAPPA